MTKKIAVLALKGGVGKSSVVAGTVLALAKKGFKVGALDIDVTGSNLYSALGLEHSPRWLLDTQNQRVVVPKVNDSYWLLSIASHVGEDYAVLWGRSQHLDLTSIKEALEGNPTPSQLETIRRKIDDIISQSKWNFVRELLSEIVTWPETLDYLIADLPPTSSDEMFSFFHQVRDLHGVIIVSLPTQIANIGLTRTIDLLRVRQIPIIGLVANMDGFLTTRGEVEYQFLSPRVELREVAKKCGIPFLVSIPQTSSKAMPYFSELAEKVVSSKPVVLKEVTKIRKLKRKLVEVGAGLLKKK